MEQITDPLPGIFILLNSIIHFTPDIGLFIGLLVLACLIFISAFISGSETAFFSLSTHQLDEISETNTKKSQKILYLINHPKKLLATILIANNFANVGIVILSAYLIGMVFDFTEYPLFGFVFEVVIVTFLLLLFGEITPKIYANQINAKFAFQAVNPLYFMFKVLSPASTILAYSTSLVDKRITKKGHDLSKSELDDAIDLTNDGITNEEGKNILRGIVKFSEMETREVMKSRVDISAINLSDNFTQIMAQVMESGFSRIPVYNDSLDQIKGVLYVKDLLPYLNETTDFHWQKLIRPAFFVPENKKINDLLQEFRKKKIHLAIVVDEYGGTSGLVTLEDILEEIVGEINDEFDDTELEIDFEKIDDRNYLFEAKTSINDFCKILKIDSVVFDDIEGDFDTLAGLFLEIFENIPSINSHIKFKNYGLEIIELDHKRIKKIKVTLPEKQ